MGASVSEVVVNHESELSTSKKPIIFLSFLFLQTDILFEVGIILGWSCSKQKQLSRPAARNFGNSYLQLIAMILISSTESTTSTSLIY